MTFISRAAIATPAILCIALTAGCGINALPRKSMTPTPTPSTAKQVAESEGVTYYANCAEAVKAGVAPLTDDEPGYRPGLDTDKDGYAC